MIHDAPDCRWSWTWRPGRAGANVAVADTEEPSAALPARERDAVCPTVLTVRVRVVVAGMPPAAGACTRYVVVVARARVEKSNRPDLVLVRESTLTQLLPFWRWRTTLRRARSP